MAYLYTFFQSNLIEVLFLMWALRADHKPLKVFLFVTFMNSLTHPWVFFGWMAMSSSYLVNILSAEAFAILVETAFLFSFLRLLPLRAFILSSIANLLSWQLGPILTWYFFYS